MTSGWFRRADQIPRPFADIPGMSAFFRPRLLFRHFRAFIPSLGKNFHSSSDAVVNKVYGVPSQLIGLLSI
jgi:hypothetical protein